MAQLKSQKNASAEKKKTTSTLAKNYLILYNFIQTIGWSYLLYQVVEHYLTGSTSPLYDKVKWTVFIFQNAALLEVIHAAIRIVSSNPIITAMQIASRIIVVNGAFIGTIAARETIGLPMALLAWSITEVIRYGNYALTLLNCLPYFLQWLRYSTFIILYPLGVTGELLCLYAAQGEVGRTKFLTIEMPNRLNFIFNYQYALWFIMFLYLPLFPKMFMHMVVQRRKVLGRTKKE